MSTGNAIESSAQDAGRNAPQERESLSGRFEHRLDPQRRLTIPLKLFEPMRNPASVSIMRSLRRKRCLDVYAKPDWDARLRPFREKPATNELSSDFLREISELTQEVPVDAQNRIRIPEEMLAFAELDTDIVVLGTGACFEIWALKNRPKVVEDIEARVESLARQAKEAGF